jgi:precorrin-6Y C5,15-methyltransferase (decarboxylating)
MPAPILIVGLGAEGPAGLRPELILQVEGADFLAAGARHLAFFPGARGERFVVQNNLGELAAEIDRRLATGRCVVLASGDPLFYGMGKFLSEHFGPAAIRVEPALSSMQLAFARASIAWQDAALASVHGRDLRTVLLPLLGRPAVGLFTDEHNNPAAVARFFLGRGLDDYEGFVGQDLGTAHEHVTGWLKLSDLAEQSFSPLSYLVLRRLREHDFLVSQDRRRGQVPGVPDEEFSRPAEGHEVMTRQEVRSVVLGKLAGPLAAGDTVWDIGAGLGTVAVELAVLRPGAEVVAVERDPGRAAYLGENRARFGAYNVRVVQGEAPEALQAESERPRTVFVGGSGGRLGHILDLVASRLCDGGVVVAAFVTLEHLALALQRVQGWGLSSGVTEVQVARSDVLGGLTGLKPQRAVFLVQATKPVS